MKDLGCTFNLISMAKIWFKRAVHLLSMMFCHICLFSNLPEEGGVDFLELGTTSPKLEDEFAPNLLKQESLS